MIKLILSWPHSFSLGASGLILKPYSATFSTDWQFPWTKSLSIDARRSFLGQSGKEKLIITITETTTTTNVHSRESRRNKDYATLNNFLQSAMSWPPNFTVVPWRDESWTCPSSAAACAWLGDIQCTFISSFGQERDVDHCGDRRKVSITPISVITIFIVIASPPNSSVPSTQGMCITAAACPNIVTITKRECTDGNLISKSATAAKLPSISSLAIGIHNDERSQCVTLLWSPELWGGLLVKLS